MLRKPFHEPDINGIDSPEALMGYILDDIGRCGLGAKELALLDEHEWSNVSVLAAYLAYHPEAKKALIEALAEDGED